MPLIKTTPTVKFALWALRVYLLLLLSLIAFKFVRVYSQSHAPATASPTNIATNK